MYIENKYMYMVFPVSLLGGQVQIVKYNIAFLVGFTPQKY